MHTFVVHIEFKVHYVNVLLCSCWWRCGSSWCHKDIAESPFSSSILLKFL